MTGVRGGSGMGRHTPFSDGENQQSTLRLGLSSVLCHVIGWDRLVIDQDGSVIGPGSAVNHKGSQGSSPLPFRKGLGELCETCHSKTVFSLSIHQIFTMLSYSRLAVWQKCIMWTSCGWHGNIGSYNNLIHRKMETNQLYQQEINNWKLQGFFNLFHRVHPDEKAWIVS